MSQLVRDAYLDEDNLEAAKRFEGSEEFQEVLAILRNNVKNPPPWKVLDIGAGNGIAAYALAKSGHKVFALEPDPSSDVGAGAVKRLNDLFTLNIEIVQGTAEHISLPDNTVDIVYVRQTLHHVKNLRQSLKEIYRVLRGGGYLLATREHVVDDDEQLKQFLESHPLHKWYGGENACTLKEYTDSVKRSGLKIASMLGPFESVINFAPMTLEDMRSSIATKFRYLGIPELLKRLFKINLIWNLCAWILTKAVRSPGRLYSFIAFKPEVRQQ